MSAVTVTVSEAALPRTVLPLTVSPSIVTVPVNVGLFASDLEAIAVAMLSNSVSNSEPRMILPESPDGKESFASKSVVFV